MPLLTPAPAILTTEAILPFDEDVRRVLLANRKMIPAYGKFHRVPQGRAAPHPHFGAHNQSKLFEAVVKVFSFRVFPDRPGLTRTQLVQGHDVHFWHFLQSPMI
jgi:hypothetical protein